MIGNSSSGLTEAPSFHLGTINIGDRQRGRLQATSIINCTPERNSITLAIKRLYSASFQKTLKTVQNPYGEAGASKKIVQTLERISFQHLVKKTFYDLSVV